MYKGRYLVIDSSFTLKFYIVGIGTMNKIISTGIMKLVYNIINHDHNLKGGCSAK